MFKVTDNIRSHLPQSVSAAHDGFFACPTRKPLLFFSQLIIFGDFFNAFIKDFLIFSGQFDFG